MTTKSLVELVPQVLEHLDGHHHVLYKCLLVNRLWCREAIPVLWRYPFNVDSKNFSLLMQRYVDSFTLSDRENVMSHIEYPKDSSYPTNIRVLNDSSPLRQPLFDYPTYLRVFDVDMFNRAYGHWFHSIHNFVVVKQQKELRYKLLKLLLQHAKSLSELIFCRDEALDAVADVMRLIAERHVHLRTFKMWTYTPHCTISIEIARCVAAVVTAQKTGLVEFRLSGLMEKGMDIVLAAVKTQANTLTALEFDECNFLEDQQMFSWVAACPQLRIIQFDDDCCGIHENVVVDLRSCFHITETSSDGVIKATWIRDPAKCPFDMYCGFC